MDHNHTGRIFKIVQLSQTARLSFDQEGYRTILETDEVDPESILQVLFGCLLQDLRGFGVEMTLAPREIYENYHTLDGFIELMSMIFPISLYPQIRRNATLRNALSNMLENTIDVSDKSTIVTYLKWLGFGHDPFDEKYVEIVHFLLGHISSTDQFDMYLTGLLEAETVIPNYDFSVVERGDYHAWVKNFAFRAYAACDVVDEILTSGEEKALVRRRMEIYIRNLLQPDTVDLYTWLFLKDHDPRTTTAEEQMLYIHRLSELAAGTKVYPGYYRANQQTPTIADLFAIICRIYGESGTEVVRFKNAVTAMWKYCSSAGIPIAKDGRTLVIVSRLVEEIEKTLASDQQ